MKRDPEQEMQERGDWFTTGVLWVCTYGPVALFGAAIVITALAIIIAHLI